MVVPVFPRVSETFIVSKFLGLLGRGWDVHVVCDRRDDDAWARFPELKASPALRRRIHTAWRTHPRGRVALLAPAVAFRCLTEAPARTMRYVNRGYRLLGDRLPRQLYLDAPLLLLGPDVVHFEFGALAPERMYLGELLGCRVVVSFRGYDLNYVGLDEPNHYAAVWARADALHFLGEDLWRRAQRRGCPRAKPRVLVPPAIDARVFMPNGGPRTERSSGPVRILSVGRLEWKKGYEHALVAVRALLDRGVPCEYRIVGDGAFMGGLAFARHQLGLDDVVIFLGQADRETVLSEMREADVFLQASISEGFCNAALEAQAMELPVVCTDADGLPENVEDGVTGIVVPRRDTGAMANALAALAADPERRRRMGEAGRRRVASRFRIEDQISAFDALYRSVLTGSRPASAPGDGTATEVPA
jgi:colanic acid/amylovoran biosynthesis glycosyltransferase